MMIAQVWGVALVIGACLVVTTEQRASSHDGPFVIGFLITVGLAPSLVLWVLGQWFGWLRE